jgi:hypothetical protein
MGDEMGTDLFSVLDFSVRVMVVKQVNDFFPILHILGLPQGLGCRSGSTSRDSDPQGSYEWFARGHGETLPMIGLAEAGVFMRNEWCSARLDSLLSRCER